MSEDVKQEAQDEVRAKAKRLSPTPEAIAQFQREQEDLKAATIKPADAPPSGDPS